MRAVTATGLSLSPSALFLPSHQRSLGGFVVAGTTLYLDRQRRRQRPQWLSLLSSAPSTLLPALAVRAWHSSWAGTRPSPYLSLLVVLQPTQILSTVPSSLRLPAFSDLGAMEPSLRLYLRLPIRTGLRVGASWEAPFPPSGSAWSVHAAAGQFSSFPISQPGSAWGAGFVVGLRASTQRTRALGLTPPLLFLPPSLPFISESAVQGPSFTSHFSFLTFFSPSGHRVRREHGLSALSFSPDSALSRCLASRHSFPLSRCGAGRRVTGDRHSHFLRIRDQPGGGFSFPPLCLPLGCPIPILLSFPSLPLSLPPPPPSSSSSGPSPLLLASLAAG